MDTYTDSLLGACKAVAFTGHRSFKATVRPPSLFTDTEQSAYERRPLRERLLDTLSRLYDDGYRDFLCGMAEGFDLLAAEAVLELQKTYTDIRLAAVVPHPEQSARFDTATRSQYDRVIASATEIVTVCDRYSPDCFHRRNDYLVDNSDTLVCFFNGNKGGTAYTVRRAARRGRRIINLAI